RVARITADGDHLEVINATGYQPELVAGWQRASLSLSRPLPDAIRAARPALFPTEQAILERYPDLAPTLARSGTRAVAALPMLTLDGQAIGGLVFSFSAPQWFTDEEVALMTSVAQQCALALERVRLLNAERQARAEAETALEVRDQVLAA